MNMEAGEILKFIRTKEYVFLRNTGQGGTGKTILVKDEVLDINFVCKKYAPYDNKRETEYFNRFIEEIKIMYLLSHKNIVRIYSYFLYPEYTTGYILMEHIEGAKIDDYLFLQSNEVFENIFIQLIEGFEYLEQNKVLHRDIRNENILITNDGIVKIIDFGFGKKIESEEKENASILLNWPVSEFPEEIDNCQYNHQTEVYFLGKLFEKILEENDVENFRYQHILDKMVITNPKKRIKSFSEIIQNMSEDMLREFDFKDDEKEIYLTFANELTSAINYMKNELIVATEPQEVISALEKVIKESILEEILQNNSSLISCFVKNSYNYYTKTKIEIPIQHIREFYKLLIRVSPIKQKIMLSNIIARLKSIKVKIEYEELPF